MYYYVFEAIKNAQTKRTYDKIKKLLNEYGIVGEIAVSSPARTAEELIRTGIEKDYSTAVVVGSDSHINRMISVIKAIKPVDKNREIVLGIIPTDKNSPLAERFGFDSFKSACETLKFRKVEEFDLAYIEPNRYFLTTAEIRTSSPIEIKLVIDHFQIEAQITDLIIFSNMTLTFFNQTPTGLLGKFFASLKKPVNPAGISIFKARVIQIQSPHNLPIKIEGEIATHTPVMIYRRPRALKIIVKRDRLVSEANEK